MPAPSLRLLRALVPAVLLLAPASAWGQAAVQTPVPLPPLQPPPPPPPLPPAPPPPGWAGSMGAGWAATSGNSDTSTSPTTCCATPVATSSSRAPAYYLRGDSEEAATVDRAAVEARMEYRLTPRLSAFALTGYARDRFKDIQYLVTQTAGLSYALLPAGRVRMARRRQRRGGRREGQRLCRRNRRRAARRRAVRLQRQQSDAHHQCGHRAVEDGRPRGRLLHLLARRGDVAGRQARAQGRVPEHLQAPAH